METLFLQVLNMSFTASFVIIAVLLARLPLKNAPKLFSYALWGVVLFRLVCPFSFESMLSLLPVNTHPISTNTLYSAAPRISTGMPRLDNIINPALPAPTLGDSVNPLQVWTALGEILWVVGIAALVVYSAVSLLKLRRRLVGAVRLRDNIYLADHIASPFVVGLLRPKIYLPSTLSGREQGYIIQHEKTHIRRFDHLVKIAAFAALCIHWFNPLAWAAFILCVKDMEMSCDESVMKQLDGEMRREYSASLLSLATGRKIIAGTPLAFGEGDTKSRVKNVMNYKKPAFWGMVAALVAVVAICIGFAANPQSNRESMEWAKSLSVEDIVKIELVAMPSAENERYRLLDRSEFSGVVALINESRGTYIENPEDIAGGGFNLYITQKDGARHSFCNNGNTYLVIDNDYYDAGYNWLSLWSYKKGNATLPPTFYFGNGSLMTMDQLKTIAQKGDAITWDHFAPYEGRDVGSGLYIMLYPMEEPYYVMIGGVPNEAPWYVRLYSSHREDYIDIREDSIDDFIQKHEGEGLTDLRPMLMIGGHLYLDTGKESPLGDVEADGAIQTAVAQGAKPTENEQSNFGCVGSAYVMGDGFVAVDIAGKWIVFEREIDAGEQEAAS